ncbi:MAG: heavy-metal-associated domain-containing protein [Clostridia bacterium]|jgi:copper chaperone|nr:heavy-metal-associated domain-containing protein [Clostridia bacterium]
MTKMLFKTTGMHCVSCETLVKDELDETTGVMNTQISYKENTVIVTFDETKITVEKIKSIIENEGYKVITYGDDKKKI